MNKDDYEFAFFAGEKYYISSVVGIIVSIIFPLFFIASIQGHDSEHNLESSSSYSYSSASAEKASVEGFLVFFAIIASVIIITLIVRSMNAEKDSKYPILAGTAEEMVFRLSNGKVHFLEWETIDSISHKEVVEYDEDGSSTYHYICPRTKKGEIFEISISKLDENYSDIQKVLHKYHPEISLIDF